ncbi:MAG: hypothetical protein ACKOZT_11845 [Cyanobium sp.]
MASAGTFLLDGRPLQQVVLDQVTYIGDCPGQEMRELKNISFLAAVPPAPYQRILIQNQSTGGYTDREYDERRPSAQTFSVALGQGQRGSFLTLAPGFNSFQYQVQQRLQKLLLNQGSASLQVGVNRLNLNRTFQEIREDTYCSGEKNLSRRTDLSNCSGGLVTLERIGVCPGGRSTTLSLETLGSGYRPGYRPGGGSGWNGGGNNWNGGSNWNNRPSGNWNGGGGSWGGGGWNGGSPVPQPR